MSVLNISKEDFYSQVLQSDKPVLVDFWASWCGPCKMLSPVVDELSEEVSSVKFCKVNVDEQPELASLYNIMSIPALLLFKDGKVAATSVGVKPKKAILDFISK